MSLKSNRSHPGSKRFRIAAHSNCETIEPRRLLSSISGVVFDDVNQDGFRQPDEPGVGGATIFVDYDYDGAPGIGEPSAIVGSDGRYTLAVDDRSFALQITPPEGYLPTTATTRYYEFRNGRLTGGGDTFGLVAGTATPGTRTITASVYEDANSNGRRDPGEAGVAGQTVFADYNYDNLIGSAAGNDPYGFTDADGNVTLSVESRPFALKLALDQHRAPIGTDVYYFEPAGDGFRSGGNNFGVSGRLETLGVGISLAGSVDGGWDVYSHFFINEYTIWVDANHNRRRDADERNFGIVGHLNPDLYDFTFRGAALAPGTYDIAFSPDASVGAAAMLIKSTTVQANSQYNFLTVELPSTKPVVLGQFFNDFNFNGAMDPYRTDMVFGDAVTTGYGISGTAWLDYNFNGVLDADEPRTSPFIGSSLYDGETGYYVLRPEPGRPFVVQATAAALNYGPSNPPMLRTTTGPTFTLNASDTPAHLDLGFIAYPTYLPYAEVYLDENANGTRDVTNTSTEPAVAGQTIFIDYNYDGIIDAGEPAMTSNENGIVSWGGIDNRPFALTLIPAEGYAASGTVVQYFEPNGYNGFYFSGRTFGVTTRT